MNFDSLSTLGLMSTTGWSGVVSRTGHFLFSQWLRRRYLCGKRGEALVPYCIAPAQSHSMCFTEAERLDSIKSKFRHYVKKKKKRGTVNVQEGAVNNNVCRELHTQGAETLNDEWTWPQDPTRDVFRPECLVDQWWDSEIYSICTQGAREREEPK